MPPSGIVLALIFSSAAMLASTFAWAQSSRDGPWAIEIITERGLCERLYRYYVVVEGQNVRVRSPFGETTQSAAGLLQRDGRINVTLGQAGDPVSVRGRLVTRSGAGTWSAPARGCAGRWVAHRRG